MKDTNAIQKELVKRSKKEIRSLIDSVMLLIQDFEKEAKESNARGGSDGLYWPVECSNFWNLNLATSERQAEMSHKRYSEIANLLTKTIEHNLLETMVEGKTKELLKKIDLF